MSAPDGATVFQLWQAEPGSDLWYKEQEGVSEFSVLQLDGYEFPHDQWAFLSAAEWQRLFFDQIECF